jgi:energy-dependent translational throttle protein EttA
MLGRVPGALPALRASSAAAGVRAARAAPLLGASGAALRAPFAAPPRGGKKGGGGGGGAAAAPVGRAGVSAARGAAAAGKSGGPSAAASIAAAEAAAPAPTVAEGEIVVAVRDLGKALPGGRVLFRGVSLGFNRGAKIGVLGLNGAGKSSLLRILAGRDSE